MKRKIKKKSVKKFTADQLHFNKETRRKKGDPHKDKKAKTYMFGHFTNYRKGRI